VCKIFICLKTVAHAETAAISTAVIPAKPAPYLIGGQESKKKIIARPAFWASEGRLMVEVISTAVILSAAKNLAIECNSRTNLVSNPLIPYCFLLHFIIHCWHYEKGGD